uniref:Ubiquitin-related modifier 1 homolog n=1 Tax=Clastoptera arizonana TaxID=38151 RepID=A0A1B6D505_9HEMI
MSVKNEEDINLCIEFGGGAELLFNKIKKHQIRLPSDKKPWTIKTLLVWLKNNLLSERPELFLQGETVRPGILVLINQSDWELMLLYIVKVDHVFGSFPWMNFGIYALQIPGVN